MYLKKVLAMLFVIVVAINCCSVFASAEDIEYYVDEEIVEEYQIANKLDNILSISGTTATYISTANINGNSITVEHALQKYWGLWIWNDVAGSTESKTVNSSNIYLRSTKSGLDSGTYRIKSTFTMTNSLGQTETVTIYSDEETVS